MATGELHKNEPYISIFAMQKYACVCVCFCFGKPSKFFNFSGNITNHLKKDTFSPTENSNKIKFRNTIKYKNERKNGTTFRCQPGTIIK